MRRACSNWFSLAHRKHEQYAQALVIVKGAAPVSLYKKFPNQGSNYYLV